MAQEAAELSALPEYIGNVLQAMIPLLGITSFIMILVGGFMILSSAGNPEGMKKGSQTISLAIAGIVLSILAWLSLVIIENITGVSVTEFKFGFGR